MWKRKKCVKKCGNGKRARENRIELKMTEKKICDGKAGKHSSCEKMLKKLISFQQRKNLQLQSIF